MGDPSTAEDEVHPGDQHDIPAFEAHASSSSLKDRIKLHYNLASDYYYSLWYPSPPPHPTSPFTPTNPST
jgi:hypothetical protein